MSYLKIKLITYIYIEMWKSQKLYYQKNKEDIKKKSRERYVQNREEHKRANLEYYHTHVKNNHDEMLRRRE
eukprot:SAG11_NODE_1807_length_4228_cov_3.662146_1_plen_70_part_10